MIRALAAGDVADTAAWLAELPLMRRYGRTRSALEAGLAAGRERGDGLLVHADGGLCWYLRQGSFGLGAYLKLLAARVPGGGVGAGLLTAYEADATTHAGHSFLLVSDFNGAAQRFYQRHGYAHTGTLPGLVLPDVAELLFWKRL